MKTAFKQELDGVGVQPLPVLFVFPTAKLQKIFHLHSSSYY